MRICPKCGAENSDQRHSCANCQEYIGNVSPSESHFSMEDSILRQEKRSRNRVIIYVGTVLLFFGAYSVILGITAAENERLTDFLLRCLWFLPSILLLCLPYTRLFHLLIEKQKEKKALHFPFFTLRLLGTIGMVVNTCGLYDCLLRVKPQ